MDELLGAGFMDDGSDGEDGDSDDHVSPSMSLSISYKTSWNRRKWLETSQMKMKMLVPRISTTMHLLRLWMTWKVCLFFFPVPCFNVHVFSDDGRAHITELSKLAEKDPEFYKYLQENDQELLDFDLDKTSDDEDEPDEDGDVEMEGDAVPVLTRPILQKWQKALLEVSLISFNEFP